MKAFVLKSGLLFLALTVAGIIFATTPALAKIGAGYSIQCGNMNGQPIECNMSTHRCLECTEERGWWLDKTTYHTYNCVSRKVAIPGNCTMTTEGGVKGDVDRDLFGGFINVAHEEGINCVTSNLMNMYTSTCYSCEIVQILASAFIKAAARAYDVVRQAANAILVIATILWIGLFVLKNISAFTTVEPMKMLQDLFVELFKVMLAFVIINSGISTILHYTLEPIMMAGTDFGDAIITSTVGINEAATGAVNSEIAEQRAKEAEEEKRRQEDVMNRLFGGILQQ